MMSNMDQRISRIENLIVKEVDSDFTTINPPLIPEPLIPTPTINQVIPNQPTISSTPDSSSPMDLQTEVRNMQQQFGGELASAISQMKSFIGSFASMTGNPDNSLSSNSNSSQ